MIETMRGKQQGESEGAHTKRLATRDDVCRAADVSTATVSRVLNNKPGVRADVRQKVLRVARELNYVPRAAARNLSGAKSDTLGVVFQDLTAGWFLTIMRGIMNRSSGTYHVLNALSTREGDEFELPNRLLAEGRVDGLIWLDARITSRMIGRIKQLGVPFVLLQYTSTDPSINTVSIEFASGCTEAVRHLLRLGYRRLMLITGAPDDESSIRKMAGVQEALREQNVVVPPEEILVGHHVAAHAIGALEARFKANSRPPEAVFAFNDDMAIAVMTWLREHGIRVPDDVAVVGFDGIPEAKHIGLTTVDTPMYEMGVIAAQTLMDIIADPSGKRDARQVMLRGHLSIRSTCGAKLKGARTE